MFDRSHRGFEFLVVELFIGYADVLNKKAERNLFGDFQRAFDLVHGFHSMSAVGRGDVYWWRAGASPLVVGIERRMHGMQRHAASVKPLGNLFYVRVAVRIVEVLPRGKNLARLHAAAQKPVQNARMQTLPDI